MTELKDCPFCGREARIWIAPCNIKIACKSQVECAAQVGPYDTEEEAITAWNRREELAKAKAEGRLYTLPVPIGYEVKNGDCPIIFSAVGMLAEGIEETEWICSDDVLDFISEVQEIGGNQDG